MTNKKLYNKSYILALYDKQDNLINTFDNCEELAKYFNRNKDSITCSVGRCINKKIDFLIIEGIKYKVYAIKL